MNTRNRLLVNLRLIVPNSAIFVCFAVAGLPPIAEWLQLHPVLSAASTMFSFWAGVVVLSAQSWQAETTFGTLPALLLQPVSRQQLWKEKAVATAVALTPLLILHLIAVARFSILPAAYFPFALVWLGAVVLSTMPHGFLVKSNFEGGLHLAVLLGVPLMVMARWISGSMPTSEEQFLLTALTFATLLAYLWTVLNRVRKTLSVAELTVQPQVDQAFAPSWDWVERKLDVLRPVRTRPLLNFVKKELRLLWLFWVYTLVTSIALIALIPFRMTEWGRNAGWPAAIGDVITGVLISFVVLFAAWLPGLAFALERVSGLHTLHMTLPISSRRVWMLRALTVSASACIAVVWLLVLSGVFLGQAVDKDFEYLLGPRLVGLPVVAALLALLSLCCSTAGGGKEESIGAAVGIPFSMAALWIVGRVLIDMGFLFRAHWFESLLGVLHPYPFSDLARGLFTHPAAGSLLATGILLSFLAGAVAISYRTFSIERPSGIKYLTRFALVAAGFAFVSGASYRAPYIVWISNQRSADSVLAETATRVRMLNTRRSEAGATQPLSIEDLEKSKPLSSLSRRWLSNPAALPAPPTNGQINGFRIEYDLHVQLKGGWTCTMAVAGALAFNKLCKPAP